MRVKQFFSADTSVVIQTHTRALNFSYLFVVSSLLLASCGGSNEGNSQEIEAAAIADIFQRDRARMLTQLATEVIPQGYDALAVQTEALRIATEDFCASPAEISLSELRDQWRAAKSAHAYTQGMEFGDPVTALDGSGNQSRSRRMYIRDVSESQMSARLDALIGGSDEITETVVAESNITIQGFQAIEFVLFGALGSNDSPGIDAFGGSEESDRRCDYLLAATANIDSIADAILNDWLPSGGNFAAEFASAGNGSSVYADRETALDDAFSVLNSLVQVMRDDKVGELLASLNPEDAESWRARQSLDNFRNNLEGMYAVYTGGDGFGADDFYAVTTEENIGEQNVRISFDDVRSGIDVVFEPFSDAVQTDFGVIRLELLQGYTADLAEQLEERIFLTVTGSSADFNFNDGD